MNTEQFIAAVNKLRRDNKNRWYQFGETVNGKAVQIKGYNTWLQIFRVDGIQQNTVMDISVKDFTGALESGIKV